MANLLEYTLSLQDRMSSRLRQIGVNSDAALNRFAALERQSREVTRSLHESGNAVGSLRQKLELLKAEREWIPQSAINDIRRYNREIQGLERQINRLETSGGGMRRYFTNAMSQIPFAGLLTNPLVLAGAAAGQAVRLGIQSDLLNTSFEVLLNSKDAAKGLIDDITKYGMTTPYDKMGLSEAAKMMLGFGIAQDRVMPNLRAIGDIAMGDANKMNSLALAFSQVSSAGKLQGQDLLQMINAGFNPLNIISKQTGKSMAVLKEEMSKGGISAKMVESAFMAATSEGGQFYKMAEKMGQTLGGQLAQLMDSINEKFLKFYSVIQPAVTALFALAGAALDAGANGIGWLVDKFNEGNPVMMMAVWAIGAVTAALIIMKAASMAQAAWTGIVTFANNVQTASWWSLNAAMLANPMTWIIAGVIALIALIGFLIYKVDGWGEAWHHTVEGVKSMFGAAMSFLKLEWLAIEHVLMTGIEALMFAWYKLKGLWDEEGANEGLAKIQAASDKRMQEMGEEGKKLVEQGKSSMQHFAAAGGSLKVNDKSLGDFKNDMMGALGMGGIADPNVPGTKTVKSGLPTGENSNVNKSNTGIATGGTKHNYITINLDSLINALTIQGKDFKDSTDQMASQSQDALLRVLAMANTAGS